MVGQHLSQQLGIGEELFGGDAQCSKKVSEGLVGWCKHIQWALGRQGFHKSSSLHSSHQGTEVWVSSSNLNNVFGSVAYSRVSLWGWGLCGRWLRDRLIASWSLWKENTVDDKDLPIGGRYSVQDIDLLA